MNNDFFPTTKMPDKGWWQALWPNPKGVLQSLGIEPEMSVVDLCCGDGHFTKSLCELVPLGAAWALDLDKDLLTKTEKACSEHSNFNSIFGDARKLHMQINEPVDFVLIANTFHGVPDKQELSESVHKSLKPNGYFAIINWYRRPRENTTVFNQPRGPKTEIRMEPEEVVTYVESAGFKFDRKIDVGPYHYAIIFVKNIITSQMMK